MDTRWLAGAEPSSGAALRLFCLPYAGGAAAAYRPWRELAPPGVEVLAVELPGRATRVREEPYVRLTPLVRALAGAVADGLDRPFALFGHSMGALVAFELTRALRRMGLPMPRHLFVSAADAPDARPGESRLFDAPDEEVKARLRRLNGTPLHLLEDEELMTLILPTLRADFAVLETYEYREEPPLPVPFTVLGGTADPSVSPAALLRWRRHSAVSAELRLFAGDHFYLNTVPAELVRTVVERLGLPESVEGSRW
ncbi:thioesterase II family protein [Dactylosporangium sp. CA-233914]|uniref:thioesterase II family protein n=1 Tax=Dactylosporangium sp. CA-233914 TaxID=3239934 RepID=UPI003D8B078B